MVLQITGLKEDQEETVKVIAEKTKAYEEHTGKVKSLEEEAKKPPVDRKLPEFGTDQDFQLAQALKKLKGQPVLVSKTAVVEDKEKAEKDKKEN